MGNDAQEKEAQEKEATSEEMVIVAIEARKQSLINELARRYRNLMDFVNELPIAFIPAIQKACFDFDTGMLWIMEVIRQSELDIKEANKE